MIQFGAKVGDPVKIGDVVFTIAGVLKMMPGVTHLVFDPYRIDRDLILEELTPLAELKEEPEILSKLNDLFESTSRI